MKKTIPLRVFQVILIVAISAFAGYIYGTSKVDFAWKNFTPVVNVTSKTPPPGQNIDMKMFYEVLDRVNADYFDKTKIDTKKMLEGAINGMLASLDDPYTSYFPPKQNTEFKQQLAGEFSGIGAELTLSPDNRVKVLSPLDDSPAEKAGIRAGDLVVKVNGEDTFGWTVPQAVEKIRGPRGTSVDISVLHEGAKTPVTMKIVRDTIVIKSVTGWLKNFSCNAGGACQENSGGKQIAYIRLSQYGDKTNNEWISHVNELRTKLKDQGSAGLILDLRNNPGGYLNDAVFIVSEFIDSGVVVIQEDDTKEQEKLSVTRRGTLLEIPIVVLINKGSASASEITAGALRDHKRATLLGENSFGKGTVQQAVELGEGASVHVSVARWLTPNETWVNKVGLKPDIEVAYDASGSAKMKAGLDNQLEAAIRELLK